jgi:hypothetical protein
MATFPKNMISSAALGTNVHSFNVPDRTQLSELVTKWDGLTSPSQQLLATASALMLAHRTAPIKPTISTPADPVFPMDRRPLCGGRTIRLFMLMQNGHYGKVVTEWLRAVAVAEQRVPEELLPTLLELGNTNKTWRALILDVIGERGYWLAEQAREMNWGWCCIADPDHGWATEDREMRKAQFENLRHVDPAAARDLLIATWDSESEEDRIGFLNLLKGNLNMDDEPFLESLLTDKPTAQSETARQLLAWLPESRITQRMQARMTPRLELILTASGKGSLRLTRSLQALDPQAVRDGIMPGAENREQLRHVSNFIPPRYWCQLWNITPAGLVRLLEESNLVPMLAGCFWSAAGTADIEMLEALLPQMLHHDSDSKKIGAGGLSACTPEQKETLVRRWLLLKNGVLTIGNPPHPAMVGLRECQWTWSHDLTLLVLDGLDRGFQASKLIGQSAADWIRPFMRFMSPDLKTEILMILRHMKGGNWEQYIEEQAALLDFRAEMLEAVTNRD